MKVFFGIALSALAAGCLLAAAPVVAQEGNVQRSGQEIVTTVCSDCHSHVRICYNLDKGKGFWEATTRRMVSNGAPMTFGEVDVVAGYLSGLEQGSSLVCR